MTISHCELKGGKHSYPIEHCTLGLQSLKHPTMLQIENLHKLQELQRPFVLWICENDECFTRHVIHSQEGNLSKKVRTL